MAETVVWLCRSWVLVSCYKCAVEFLVPSEFDKNRRGDHASFSCPNGHGQHYTAESEAEKLRRERDKLRQQMARVEDEKREAEERAAKAEAATARLKKRTTGGVCPCCTRTFSNVRRHMASKHPDVVPLKKIAKARA